MDKNKRDLIVASLLVIIFIFLIGKNFVFKKGPSRPAASAVSVEMIPAINAVNLGSILQNRKLWEEQQATAENGWGRDPFSMGSLGASQDSSNFILSGIVWDPKLPVAIVNGNMYKPGDTIEDYVIKEISQDSVTVVRGEEKIRLQLFEAQSKE